MQISIINRETGAMTVYDAAQLRKMAHAAVRLKGKLTGYWVNFTEGGRAQLVAQWVGRDGWSQSDYIAI